MNISFDRIDLRQKDFVWNSDRQRHKVHKLQIKVVSNDWNLLRSNFCSNKLAAMLSFKVIRWKSFMRLQPNSSTNENVGFGGFTDKHQQLLAKSSHSKSAWTAYEVAVNPWIINRCRAKLSTLSESLSDLMKKSIQLQFRWQTNRTAIGNISWLESNW